MDSKNKKLMVTTIIGIVTLVLLVAGATYAYFMVPIKNEFSETKVSSKIDNIGTVSLLPETTGLTLNLTIDDMLQNEAGLTYYSTKDGNATLPTSEIIAKATVNGEGIFNCTYDVTVEATGENSMYNAIQKYIAENNNIKSYGENNVQLWLDGIKYDFSNENLFPINYSGEIYGLTEDNGYDIITQLSIANKGSNQDFLKGTDLELTYKITNFDCKTTKMSESAKYILATSPENISTELIDGLYRYQGTQEQVTNNYICWGTRDKEECLAENSEYLYRIIGITPDGQLKIIKNKITMSVWNNLLNTYNTVIFSDTSLAKTMNDNMEWTNNLVNHSWKYGKLMPNQFSEIAEVQDVLDIEKNTNNVYSSKTGLISFSDFYNHDTCYKDSDLNYTEKCTDGWLLLNNLNNNFDPDAKEWTAYRITTGSESAFVIDREGAVNTEDIHYERAYYRPVAYVLQTLNLKNGTGTITDPYIYS